jgi:hypothetical protein
MKKATLTKIGTILKSLQAAGRSLRRGVVAICAALTLIVLYGLSSIGTQIVSVIGISGLALATSAEPAQAQKRSRSKNSGNEKNGERGKRRRRRRKRRRRRRGDNWVWEWMDLPNGNW